MICASGAVDIIRCENFSRLIKQIIKFNTTQPFDPIRYEVVLDNARVLKLNHPVGRKYVFGGHSKEMKSKF